MNPSSSDQFEYKWFYLHFWQKKLDWYFFNNISSLYWGRPDQTRPGPRVTPVSQPTQGHGLSYGEERQGTLSASQSLNDLFEAEMELH